jgi:threonylcarbamoyladenosine tRNA methylthiotransferase MtaB
MGCKVNQAESAEVINYLTEAGFQLGGAGCAEAVVLNTCAVTGRAEREALSLLRRLRRLNPGAVIVAMGCLARLRPGFLIGPDLADAVILEGPESLVKYLPPVSVSAEAVVASDLKQRTRALLKVQDGCSCNCAYCTVPLARGPSRSVLPQKVMEDLKAFLASGYKEIVLTGIHMGHWGQDLEPSRDLAYLLSLINLTFPYDGQYRLRLSSLEPLEVPLAWTALTEYGFLAPHIHAPLQSGSDKLLKAMGRPYTSDTYRQIILDLVGQTDNLALGTDVLVGFPGETDEDFALTCRFLENLPYSYLHVFPYSSRPGTQAASWPGQVSSHLKKERVLALKELDQKIRAKFLLTQYPLKHLALLDNSADSEGRWKVLTGSYVRAVWADKEMPTPGTLNYVRLSPPGKPGCLPEARLW